MHVIDVHNLTKYYISSSIRKKKSTIGIEDVSFSVKKGEIYGFLGPNGAGKTTTMRLLLDLIRPTSGTAEIFGKDVFLNSKELRKHIGYIPGEINFYNNKNAGYLLKYYQRLQGEESVLMDKLVDYFDIPLNRPVKTFSKGMKQKLAIIQAFMHDPELIIMDEPTAGLDPLVQQRFYDFIISQKESGKTIFISTHILSEAQKICDRVAIIRSGKIIAVEKISELNAKSGNSITVSFVEDVEPKDIQNSEIVSIRKTNGSLHIRTGTSLTETMRKISSYTIKDITIGQESLEDVFMHYYEGEDDV